MAKTLDDNERAYLRALEEVDPGRESWVTCYASGFDLAKHGADPVAAGITGRYQVMKRLVQRGLVDKEPGRMSKDTGVGISDEGREALKAAGG
jgi:hypothetical protein